MFRYAAQPAQPALLISIAESLYIVVAGDYLANGLGFSDQILWNTHSAVAWGELGEKLRLMLSDP